MQIYVLSSKFCNFVEVIDDLQNTYNFQEESPGVYMSENEFKAMPSRQYQLKITTSSGRSYTSHPTELTPEAQINDVIAVKEFNRLFFRKFLIIRLIKKLDWFESMYYFKFFSILLIQVSFIP